MTKWIERAKREIPKRPGPRTVITTVRSSNDCNDSTPDGQLIRFSALTTATTVRDQANTEISDAKLKATLEGEARAHPFTRAVLARFPGAAIVDVRRRVENPPAPVPTSIFGIDLADELRTPSGSPPTEADRRYWAELADKLGTELDPLQPRWGTSPRRWYQFVADAKRACSEGWLHRAIAIGWEVIDLFGCNPGCPFGRYDSIGLLLALNSYCIAAVSKDSAIIETPTGARLSSRRCANDASRQFVWSVE